MQVIFTSLATQLKSFVKSMVIVLLITKMYDLNNYIRNTKLYIFLKSIFYTVDCNRVFFYLNGKNDYASSNQAQLPQKGSIDSVITSVIKLKMQKLN